MNNEKGYKPFYVLGYSFDNLVGYDGYGDLCCYLTVYENFKDIIKYDREIDAFADKNSRRFIVTFGKNLKVMKVDSYVSVINEEKSLVQSFDLLARAYGLKIQI